MRVLVVYILLLLILCYEVGESELVFPYVLLLVKYKRVSNMHLSRIKTEHKEKTILIQKRYRQK